MSQTPESSCIPKEPMLKLGEGTAPVLDYGIPQKNEFSVYGRIRSSIPSAWFLPATSAVPPDNWWIRAKDLDMQAVFTEIDGVLNRQAVSSGLVLNAGKLHQGTASPKIMGAAVPIGKTAAMAGDKLQAVPSESVASLASAVTQGLMPVVVDSFGGRPDIVLLPQPQKPKPGIYIIEEYGVASYLGNYGAGKTVSTFSLLPGEKTTITISTYAERTETSSIAQSILDSFTQDSADEFETTLQEETGQSSEKTKGLDTTSHYDMGLKIDLFGTTNIGAESDSQIESSNASTRESYVNMTSNAMEKHVTSSSSVREVEVNSTSTSTDTTRTEQSITRQLENINRSRVLNFAFRQLQQEYITVTYLKNVRVMFTNGYPESVQIVDIPQVPDLLRSVLQPKQVNEALVRVLESYCSVYNYLGERISFLEQVTEKISGCPFAAGDKAVTYYRKRRSLADTYEKIEVRGVILKVDRHILRTSSLIADAILGQGEALDCYNMELQDASVAQANLENQKVAAALGILEEITDPMDKADAYQKMFNPPPGEVPVSEAPA